MIKSILICIGFIAVVAYGERAPCACNKMLGIVCGSDGKFYMNGDCLEKCAPEGTTTADRSVCVNKLKENRSPCPCSKMLGLVCGSDGKFYRNGDCMAKCAPEGTIAADMKTCAPRARE